MSNLHNLNTYAVSKQITEEFPEVLKLLDKYKQELYKYKMYKPVANVLESLDKNIEQSKYILEHYKKINDRKGISNG